MFLFFSVFFLNFLNNLFFVHFLLLQILFFLYFFFYHFFSEHLLFYLHAFISFFLGFFKFIFQLSTLFEKLYFLTIDAESRKVIGRFLNYHFFIRHLQFIFFYFQSFYFIRIKNIILSQNGFSFRFPNFCNLLQSVFPVFDLSLFVLVFFI